MRCVIIFIKGHHALHYQLVKFINVRSFEKNMFLQFEKKYALYNMMKFLTKKLLSTSLSILFHKPFLYRKLVKTDSYL